MERENHIGVGPGRPGTTFHRIAGLYIFDRKLRLILLDAIERIEVALRAVVTYEISHRHGPFGHTDPQNFSATFGHAEFMAEIAVAERRSSEPFVVDYRRTYTSEPHLPLWMASELLSFGRLSRLYKACHPEIKRRIAARFDIPDVVLSSWLHSLSYVRNVCAHHSRLWNRELSVKPSLPCMSPSWPHRVPGRARVYCILVIVQHCLLRLAPRSPWRDRLFALIAAHPEVDLAAMQTPANWRSAPLWAPDGRAAQMAPGVLQRRPRQEALRRLSRFLYQIPEGAG